MLNAELGIQTRSQAIGVGQVLVDGGVLTHGEGVPEGSPGHPWVHSPAHVLFPPRSETGVAFPGQGHPVLSLC